MVKKVIKACFEEATIPYNFFMGDIYTAIKYGLKSKQDWVKIQKNSSQLDVDMEYRNIAVGEGEDAFFTLEQFKATQTLKQAFYPPTEHQILTRTEPKNRAKGKGEVRLLICDFAFSNTTGSRGDYDESDNTVLMCMSAVPHKGQYDRQVEYIETIGGGDSDSTLKRIRELYYDYDCDFIIPDGRSGGETLYNELTRPWEHPTRSGWNQSGFSVYRDMRVHTATKSKVDDLISRTVDPNAIQCIVPVYATDTTNDLMWRSLLTHLSRGDIRMLIDALIFDETLNSKKYFKLTNEERAQLKLPYIQTELLINEAINLKQNTLKTGRIQLKEPVKGHKDRIVCLAYGNAFVDKLENLAQYESERFEEFDESDWEGIFQ